MSTKVLSIVCQNGTESQNMLPLLHVALAIFPFSGGMGNVVRSGINGNLSDLLGSVIWATAVACTVSACLATFIAFVVPSVNFIKGVKSLYSDVRSNPCKRFVILLPMPFQVGYLFISAFVPQYIGYGVFFVVVIVCQIFGSLMVDRFGLFWSPKRMVFWQGYVGTALVTSGALVFQIYEFSGKSQVSGGAFAGYCLISAYGGFSGLCVTLINAQLRPHIGLFRSVSYTYIMGSLSIYFVILCVWMPIVSTVTSSDWWAFLGGVLGMWSLLANAGFATTLGFALTYGSSVCGQLLTALVLDSVGFLGTEKIPISASRLVGVLMVLTGVGLFIWNRLRAIVEEEKLKAADDVVSPTCSLEMQMGVKAGTEISDETSEIRAASSVSEIHDKNGSADIV